VPVTTGVVGGAAGEFALIGDNATNGSITEAGDDIDGGGGDDRLFGDNTDNGWTASLLTVGGSDTLNGGAGNDVLRAGPADDKLNGGPDFDDCDGEGGTDKVTNCESS
jgi:Ca2+-binding RTX toxin-like protein